MGMQSAYRVRQAKAGRQKAYESKIGELKTKAMRDHEFQNGMEMIMESMARNIVMEGAHGEWNPYKRNRLLAFRKEEGEGSVPVWVRAAGISGTEVSVAEAEKLARLNEDVSPRA